MISRVSAGRRLYINQVMKKVQEDAPIHGRSYRATSIAFVALWVTPEIWEDRTLLAYFYRFIPLSDADSSVPLQPHFPTSPKTKRSDAASENHPSKA